QNVVSGLNEGKLGESVCNVCDSRSFPPREICIQCMSYDLKTVDLPDKGTLYSYSTVHVSSAKETPYTLGYVDMIDGIRVLGQIKSNGNHLKIGINVKLIVKETEWYFVPEGE